MPLGNNKLPNSEYREWRKEHGYAAEPAYPEREKGGSMIIIGILGVLGLAGLLGLAAAGAKPTTKKATKIQSLYASWADGGTYIQYYWDGYLQESPSQTGINRKTIKLQLWLKGASDWLTIDTQTTANRGGTGNAGYFFFNKAHPKPMAEKVRIIFEGDAEYEAVQLWYETTSVF